MRRLSRASPGPENITLNCHDVNKCLSSLSSRLSTAEGELAEREREEAGATVHVGKSKLTRREGVSSTLSPILGLGSVTSHYVQAGVCERRPINIFNFVQESQNWMENHTKNTPQTSIHSQRGGTLCLATTTVALLHASSSTRSTSSHADMSVFEQLIQIILWKRQ